MCHFCYFFFQQLMQYTTRQTNRLTRLENGTIRPPSVKSQSHSFAHFHVGLIVFIFKITLCFFLHKFFGIKNER